MRRLTQLALLGAISTAELAAQIPAGADPRLPGPLSTTLPEGSKAVGATPPAAQAPRWQPFIDDPALPQLHRLETAYRRGILLPWGTGDELAAVGDLLDFHERLLGLPECRDWLEEKVARSLLKQEPTALLSLAALHALLGYEEASLNWSSATDTFDRVEDWLARTRKRGPPELRPDLADLLAAVGTLLSELNIERFRQRGRDLLRRSLDLHEQPDALHVAAHLAEREADYRAALSTLDRLHEIHPGDADSRIRLAVNLARLRPEEAVMPLESIAYSDSTAATAAFSWTRRVAFGELSRLALQEGDRERALELLREAQRVLGPSEELVIRQVYVASSDPRAGRDRESVDRLVDWMLDDFEGDRGPSARAIYDRGPAHQARSVVRRWRSQIELLRPLLLEALSRTEPSPQRVDRSGNVICRGALRRLQ